MSPATRSLPGGPRPPALRADDAPPANRLGDLAWRYGPAGLFILIAALPALHVAVNSVSWSTESYRYNCSDALVFRASMEILLEGGSPYDVDTQRRHIAETRMEGEVPPYDLPFAYPPNALPILLLHAVGPPYFAYALNVYLTTVLMLVAVYGLARRFCPHPLARAMLVLGVGVGGPTLFNAQIAQTGALAAAILFACVLAFRRRPVWAGVFLGLLAFKPQYALPLGIVALVDRQWLTVMVSGLTFVAMSVLSGLLFGFHHWPSFLEVVGRFNPTLIYMGNWFALFHRFRPGMATELHADAMPVMLVGMIVLTLYCGWHRRRDEEGSLERLAFATALATLVSPNTHPYDLILWTLPVCVAARHLKPFPVWATVWVAGIVLRLLLEPHMRWMMPLLAVGLLVSVAIPAGRRWGSAMRSSSESASPSRCPVGTG